MKKPSIAVILGGKGSAPEPPESDDEMDEHGGDMDEQGEAAAQEFCEACKIGDGKKAWEAFKAMHRCDTALMDHEDEDEPEEEEEPESEK